MEEVTRIFNFIKASNNWQGIRRAIAIHWNAEYVMPVSFKTLEEKLNIKIKNIEKVLRKRKALDNLQRECLKSLSSTVPKIEIEKRIEGLWIRILPKHSPEEAVLREEKAFLRMERDGKLKTYRGRFVAILNGEVIGYNEDKMGLIKSLYKKYENNPPPMYIAKVGEKERIVEMLSPRPLDTPNFASMIPEKRGVQILSTKDKNIDVVSSHSL